MPPPHREVMKGWFQKAEEGKEAGPRSPQDPPVSDPAAKDREIGQAVGDDVEIKIHSPRDQASGQPVRRAVSFAMQKQGAAPLEGNTDLRSDFSSGAQSAYICDQCDMEFVGPDNKEACLRHKLNCNGKLQKDLALSISNTRVRIEDKPDYLEKEEKLPWYADFVEGGELVKKHAGLFWREKCTRQSMCRLAMDRFPMLEWLPKYTLAKFAKDVQAGLVVACMLIPQGMGYADVAGLPFVAGLYSGFAPLFIYFTMSSSMQTAVGPVAIISLIVGQSVPACSKLCMGKDSVLIDEPWPACANKCQAGQTKEYNPEYWVIASCIALLSGIVQAAGAPVLGFVMNFVPHPVISGFTSAGGLIIAMSQVKSIVGYKIRKDNLQVGLYDLFAGLHQTHAITVAMGVVGIVFLGTCRQVGRGWAWFYPSWKVPMKVRKLCKLPWPFILIVVYILCTWQMELDKQGVAITGKVPGGLPAFSWPNKFFERIPNIVSSTIQIVIIGFLETFAIESHFATKRKYQVRPTQEAFAIGVTNIFGGLTHCYPVSGSFSRSSENAALDSQSPMANLVTGSVMMVTLLVLTKLFYYLPLNALAANVIVAALSLVDFHEPAFLWVSSKKEFCLFTVTFCVSAFHSPELGIYISVALCAVEVLWNATRSKVAVLSDNLVLVYLPGAETNTVAKDLLPDSLMGHDVLVIRVEGTLNFTAASSLRQIISQQFKEAMGQRNINALVFDLTNMEIADTSALAALFSIVDEIEGHQIAVFIAGISPGLRRFLKIESIKAKLSVNVTLNESLKEVGRNRASGEELERLTEDSEFDNGSDKMSLVSANSSRYQSSLAQAVSAAIQTDDERRRSNNSTHNTNGNLPRGPDASTDHSPAGVNARSPALRPTVPIVPLDASNWI